MAISGSYIGLHMQDPVEEWDDAYGAAHGEGRRFRLLKSFHPEDYRLLQAVSPGTEFVFRPWIEDTHSGPWLEMAGLGPAQADAAADDYIRRFKDSVNMHMDAGYVESLNEEYPTRNAEKLRKIVAFDRAFIRRLAVHCPHVKPVVFCAAVGNPDHHEYGALLELARDAAQAGGAFGYHGYWTVYVDGFGARTSFVSHAAVGRDLQMRWKVIDAYFLARGVRVKWMLGETGATKGNSVGYQPDVLAGWKSPECWNGDEEAYLRDIAAFDDVLGASVAAQEGRLIGAVLFTSRPGDGGVWQWFNVTGSMMWRVAEHVAGRADGGPRTDDGDTSPPPPPPPDPGASLTLPASERENLWAYSVSEQIGKGISLNPGAKLQGAILGDGFTPVLAEARWADDGGNLWAWQPAERVDGLLPRRVYYCLVGPGPSYFDVFWFDSEGAQGAATGEAVWAPVGTPAERQAAAAAGVAWPGAWVDANRYGNAYELRGTLAYHTGADLNLNSPRWNADAGSGVFAVADGVVSYAGRLNENWGNVVVVRHEARGGFYARYAHLATVAVSIGDRVYLGDELGTVGGSDVGLPDHLHFDISPTDKLRDNPGDWPGRDYGRLRRDYVDPKLFLER